MQSITEENNLAETGFSFGRHGRGSAVVHPPVHEVDFCSHATLATAQILAIDREGKGDLVFAIRGLYDVEVVGLTATR
jgi:predicted PhzF superfamily epimerase YddE/YHI9